MFFCLNMAMYSFAYVVSNYLSLHICRHDRMLKEVTIALVGKYTKLEDAYASVIKSLQHASMACNHRLNLKVSVLLLKTEIGFGE